MTKAAKISIILALIIFLMPIGMFLLDSYISWGVIYFLVYLFLVALFFIVISKSAGQAKIQSNNTNQKAHVWIPVIIVVISFIAMFVSAGMGSDTNDIKCMKQMSSIYVALEDYKDDHNQKYPDASGWFGFIKVQGYISKDFNFICSAKDRGGKRTVYMMNPDCKPDSPGDAVLLFETNAPTVGLSGGAELINPESHCRSDWFWGYKYYGSNVLFNDGNVKFVAAEDFKNLRWK